MHSGLQTSRDEQEKHTCTLLKRLTSSSPRFFFSNFNEILHLNEKIEGNDRNVNMNSNFRDAIQDCNLRDLGFTGHPFTWSYRRFGPHFIKEQ